MLYRPNFCCNCGEKIERLEWNLLTSRRFCVLCSIENRRHDMLPRVTVAAGALALMFGFGSLWTGSGLSEPRADDNTVGIKSSSLPQTVPVQPSGPVGETGLEVPPPPNVQASERARTGAIVTSPGDKNADKYFCGALTKKGTPCSRKVEGRGLRCFQHEGRPAAPAS